MIRNLHRWPGLLAALVILVVTLTGAALSVFPALDRLSTPQPPSGMTVAALAGQLQTTYPGLEEFRRAPSGRITAFWSDNTGASSAVIDPATGARIADPGKSALRVWLTDLHRAFLLDDAGRIGTAITAGAMLVLAVSGAALVARRVGGWRRWLAPLRGPLAGRVHVELARAAVAGLALSALTALWMSAETFDLVTPARADPVVATPPATGAAMALADMPALATIPLDQLRSITLPDPAWPGDPLTLHTAGGTGLVDPVTGIMTGWAASPALQRLSETIYMLHTGEGAAVLWPILGLVLGLMALAAPVMAATGTVIWWTGRRGQRRLRGTLRAGLAQNVILVGSEGGSTWGFATTLGQALMHAGETVHLAPMSAFAPERYGNARRILVLAVTYGDGAPPASAKGFLDTLAAMPAVPAAPLAVLGFGDRSFRAYCGFAQAVTQAAAARGWATLIAPGSVDRQSPQDFARWGQDLGAAIGVDLDLVHRPALPASHALTLVSRRDYGAAVQAPTAILRFAVPRPTLAQRVTGRLTGRSFGAFRAGDLIGILPSGSTLPRFYSLASAARDGFIEIVVKKHPGGLCSGQLMALAPGDTVTAFLRRNASFYPGHGKAPLILIGAGTGIAPLAGFVRANRAARPVQLFFGLRDPASDFLYRDELGDWQAQGRLDHLVTATSRGAGPRYVQDALRGDAAQLRDAIAQGARIMVCGGRAMAAGVTATLDDILAPAGVSADQLRAQGRYVEDVY